MRGKFKRLIKFTNNYQKKEALVLRDHLAMERTKLANERTLLSYLRTSLYLILGGIAFLGMQDLKEIRILGYFSLSLSIIVLVVGITRFSQLKRHLRKLYEPLQDKPTEQITTKENQ
jgi:putative membrane protein